MESKERYRRVSLWGLFVLYMCAGLLWLWAQASVLDYFDAPVNSRSLKWQIALFLSWLLSTAVVGVWLLQRMRRAEHRRNETAQELALIVRHAPAGMTRVQVENAEIIWANDKLASWLGLSVESLVGQDFRQLVQVDDAQESKRLITQLVDGHLTHFQMQRRCVHQSTGRVTQVLCTFSRVHTAVGKPVALVCVLQDMSEMLAADERQRLAATVVENTSEGVVVTDANSRILSINKSFTRLLGFTEEEMLGQTPRMFKSGRHDKTFYEQMWESMRTTGHWQGEVWNKRKNGEIFPERMSLSAVKDDAGTVTHYVCMFTDISAEKAREKQLEFLAQRDVLTGLPNRSLFTRLLDEAVEQAQDLDQGLAVMLLNIDRFKDVNDSYGHSIGDKVLQHIAVKVQAALGSEDEIGRMAGDELAVIAKGLGSREEAVALAERLMAAAAQPWTSPDGLSVVVSVSVGICLYPEHAKTSSELLQGAHAAVYGAKNRSASAWCFFHEDMTVAAHERLALESRLRKALELDHMRLYYQPQIDLATGRLVGAEALVRWLDPEEGLISPARFIPVAESSGVIGPLGLWVLREACNQGQRWREAGMPDIVVAINVSLHQFLLTDIAGATAEVLRETGFPASQLELEITESALATQPEEALAVLKRLRELGLRLAIDDFGTGYSSLAHLKRFPLDLLKIDQGFIRDIPHSTDDMSISSSVIALGHAMGLKVLAEGVETREQLQFLQQKGCDYMQGYLCSRPLPAADFMQLLEKTHAGQPLVELLPEVDETFII
ncbi:MAG: EAL domain-containing protein [Comamonas sp.]